MRTSLAGGEVGLPLVALLRRWRSSVGCAARDTDGRFLDAFSRFHVQPLACGKHARCPVYGLLASALRVAVDRLGKVGLHMWVTIAQLG